MTEDQVKAGACYAMPSGVNRMVVQIGEDDNWKWVRLETINGKRPGARTKESMTYFLSVAEPLETVE